MTDEQTPPPPTEVAPDGAPVDDMATGPRARPVDRAARYDRIAVFVLVGALAGIAIGFPLWRRVASHPSRESCRELYERHAELVARAAVPERPRRPADAKPPPTKPVRADDPAVARCASEVTLAEAACAASAGDADAFERCLP